MEIRLLFPDFKSKTLTLSYDDATICDRKMVEILNSHKVKCTFNLNSALMQGSDKIHEDEIESLYAGHEIAVHTLTHAHLDWLSTVEVAQQITEDRKNLERMTGRIIDGMAYPFGLSDRNNEVEIAKICGISYARTVGNTNNFELPKDFYRWVPTCHHASKMLWDLCDRFIASPENQPSLFYMWGHSHEFENNKNWDVLEKFCEVLGEKEEIWYATNIEIIDYIKAFKMLKKSVDGKMIYNPTDKTVFVWIPKIGKTDIKPGQTVHL